MPPSQLKRLKASLRAAGVIGTQKSKKEKKRNAKAGSDARVDKHVKLQSIREEFNPFEIKTTRVKHDVSGRTKVKGAQGRPGLSKQIGEETVSTAHCFPSSHTGYLYIVKFFRERKPFLSKCRRKIRLVG